MSLIDDTRVCDHEETALTICEPKWPMREKLWFAAILLAAIATYAPTFRYLWTKWMEDAQYSIAPLVPFVSGYFIWKKWPEVKVLKRSSSVWGLVLISAALILHLAGVALDISGPSSLSLMLCLLGGCLYFHSSALVRTLAFPLAYAFFLIPVPGGILDRVGFPLQLWASGATAMLLSLTGIEVVRSGVNLSVPGYDFQVAQACSGMSSLMALVGVTAVFAYISKLPIIFKWILFALAIPIALAANVIRITTIALVGYQWGPKAAQDIYHDWSSPLLFIVAILIIIAISRGFEWLSRRLGMA
jgi:exosortase